MTISHMEKKKMNNVNVLFVISCIFVPLLLISLNYSAIDNFYAYSVPLNDFELWSDFQDSPQELKRIMDMEGSKCFTTPSQNEFCYYKPRGSGPMKTSTLAGNDVGFDGGEMHFDDANIGTSYFTMKNMTRVNDDAVLITFGDRDGFVSERTSKKTITFEFSAILEKFDTFVSNCSHHEGTSVTIVQYLGLETIGGVDYFVTWHTGADLKKPLRCDYPEIIQHSLKHDFGI